MLFRSLVAAFDLEAVLARTQPDAGSILMLLEDAGGSTVDVPLPGVAPGPESLRQERTMSFGGRSWTLRLASTHRFQVGRSRLPQGALAVGLLISLGLFLATALLQEGRLRTRALAGELGLSEANYRDLVEGLSDLVYRVDGAGRFTFLNEASQSLFGYEPGEMQGHLLRDFLTEEGGQAFSSAQDRVVAGEFLVNEPLEFRCKDGGARRVNVNARPLSDAAGRVIGTQGTMRDVTEMRRAQLALEESEEKFRSFADTVSCIILLFDDRIRYINAYATRMLGWSEAEILGQPFWAMVHPEDQALVRSRGEARVRGEIVPPRYEFRLVSKAGETRWVQFTAGRITLKGRSYGLATVFDITDRVEAEEARLRMERRFLESQKLESLGLLAGGVAHDFNNLLAAILGNAELASEMAAPDAAVRQPLEQIQNACMRASDLTRQMLAYAGQGKFVVEPLDLGEAVQGISDLMRASIPKLVEMRLDLAQERLMVEGDVAQIQQVILNLMTNAAESIGPAGGTVTLATGRRALVAQDAVSLRAAEALRPGPMVMLEVNDDGQGMDASTLDRIFDPFFTTKFQGRGLGLAAIQGIVRGHGGAIEVISVPGKGTTFRAYFPERVEG